MFPSMNSVRWKCTKFVAVMQSITCWSLGLLVSLQRIRLKILTVCIFVLQRTLSSLMTNGVQSPYYYYWERFRCIRFKSYFFIHNGYYLGLVRVLISHSAFQDVNKHSVLRTGKAATITVALTADFSLGEARYYSCCIYTLSIFYL